MKMHISRKPIETSRRRRDTPPSVAAGLSGGGELRSALEGVRAFAGLDLNTLNGLELSASATPRVGRELILRTH